MFAIEGSTTYKTHRRTPSSSSTLTYSPRDDDDGMVRCQTKHPLTVNIKWSNRNVWKDFIWLTVTCASIPNFPSPASHWYSSEVWFCHLGPLSPFWVQHVSAFYLLFARGGGRHGVTPGTDTSCTTRTRSRVWDVTTCVCLFACRSLRFLRSSPQWNCAASCAVMFSRTQSSPHVGWVFTIYQLMSKL